MVKVENCNFDPLLECDNYHPALIILFDIPKLNHLKYSELNKNINKDFKNAPFNIIKNKLSLINWKSLFYNLNIDDCLKKFYDIMSELIEKYVPNKYIYKDNYPNWISYKT